MAASESSLSHVESDVCFGGIEVFLLCAVEWQFFFFFSESDCVAHNANVASGGGFYCVLSFKLYSNYREKGSQK